MITWGIAAAIMAFVTGPISFLSLRFLLGVAEAGFFPGIILYFTYWFPACTALVSFRTLPCRAWRQRSTELVSGALLQMGGIFGLRGWQWLFIFEVIPAILLAFAFLC